MEDLKEMISILSEISGNLRLIGLTLAKKASDDSDGGAEKNYNAEDVHAVLREKSRAGFNDKIRYLLKIKYNAQKLADVPPERYAELINDVKNLE